MSSTLRDYLDFAVETAYMAGRLTLGYYQSKLKTDLKANDSPVTVADRSAEELIRERIARHYPNHAILGEEYGATESQDSSHRWIIDPIDGTKSFVRGVPLYAVLIGLEIESQPNVGVAYFPALNEMLAAATGEGCWWNGRRARVSDVSSLDEAVVTFSDVGTFAKAGVEQAWQRLQRASYICRGWGDAYGYLLVATGRTEVHLDPLMNPWDSAPFPPILQEAGGYFGDWDGNVSIYAPSVLATTQRLLPQVLYLLRNDDA